MKIYLASSWRNTHQATALADLRASGHDVYDFKNPAPGNTGFGWKQTIDRPIVDALDLLEALSHPSAVQGFGFDFNAMKWADACVLLLPCGNSAHLEAGWFAGKGKPVAVLVPELREPELMYKCFDDDHGATPLFSTMPALLEHLTLVARRLQSECTNSSPPWFTGRWRDWHRGHGCNKDDGYPRTTEGAAEIAGGGR